MEKSILLTKFRFFKLAIEEAFKSQGLSCFVAESVQEAESLTHEWKPPFIFLDLNSFDPSELWNLSEKVSSQIPIWVLSIERPENWKGLWTMQPINPVDFANDVRQKFNDLNGANG